MSRPYKARLGMTGYAQILARLRQPASIPTMIEEELAGHTTLYRLIYGLWKLGRLHICGWEVIHGKRARPMWKYGAGEDVPVPATRGDNQTRRTQAKPPPVPDRVNPELLAFDSVLSALERRVTKRQICALTGLNQQTVRAAVDALVRNGLAHRPGFMPSGMRGGGTAAIYLLGSGSNRAYRPLPRNERRKERRRQLRRSSPVNMVVATLTSAPIQIRSGA